MEKYMESIYCLDDMPLDKPSYGLSSIMRVKDFFIDEVQKKGDISIDMRYSRVLYEHKWMLTQLVDSFLADDINKDKYRTFAARNFDRAKLVHMLGLKMLISQNPAIISNVSFLIDQIVEDEKQYMPELILLLRARYENGII